MSRKTRKKTRRTIGFSSEFNEWTELRDWLSELLSEYEFIHKPRREVMYLNAACSFDIETTSWRNGEGEKRANMYIWMVCLSGKSFYGRTWEEFIGFCDILVEVLGLNTNRRIVLYVHNLAFEFQFIKCLFEWEQVFALDVRVPVYACTMSGIEFRCSYILHGASLAHMGNSLNVYQLEKKVGDLDYDLMRHSGTNLSDQELGYCLADVQVVVAYIEECILQEKGRLTNIPLTKTGYPRRLVKKAMLYGSGGWHNRKLLEGMTYTKSEFLLQRWEFAGGFTHANARHVMQYIDEVASKDEASAYPYAMIAFPLYPMGKGKKVVPKDRDHFRRMLQNYACLFHVRFTNVRPKPGVPDHIISFSKCKNVKNVVQDNGRVVTADELETAMTEIDFKCFEQFYDYDTIEIKEFYRYRRGYLPKAYIETVLDLYYKKTTLKHVQGSETDYRIAKENLNSLYGMMCTSPIRDEITYKEDWRRMLADWDDGIKRYNESKSRFISYNWGCWVTSIARANLYEAILACGDDFVYSDTDSVKVMHPDRHEDFFLRYNARVEDNLRAMCAFYGLDFELCRPKGKLIGIWEDEGRMEFKTLGAKRYAVRQDGKFSITVSGLNKKQTVPWLLRTFGNPFDAFTDDLDVPADATGKLTHTYIDTGWSDFMTDYTGNTALVWEHSCVHLEPAEYSLSMAKEFLNYINSFMGG